MSELFPPPPAWSSQPGPLETPLPRPTWSVMIPVYRPREDFLREALSSVLQQAPSPQQMQIEVVDDCSPDVDVGQMVARIAGDRVTVFRNPQNKGLAGCWNECVQRSQGNLVHILHQDDMVLPGFYHALEQGLQNHPEAGAAFSRHVYFDEQGHWRSLSHLEMPAAGIIPDWLAKITLENRIQCPSIVVRRTVYEQLGLFRTDLPHALDWEMWLRISNRHAVYHDPRLLACYRSHSGNMTSRQRQTGESLEDIFRAIRTWSSYLNHPMTAQYARRARVNFAMAGIKLARRFARERNYGAARRNLAVAVKHCRKPGLLFQAAKVFLSMGWMGSKNKPRPTSPLS